ncbi:MAG: hypothetical protein WCG27_08320, partial [Pseudomonadota bacterium]
MRRIIIALGLLAFFGQTFANVVIPFRGSSIVEENSLWIGPDQKSDRGGIDEATFNATIDQLNVIYGPVVKEKGGNLVFERNWDDGTVNAYANQDGDTWTVAMFGGLARHEVITADAFALVVCHELNHHLGGAP